MQKEANPNKIKVKALVTLIIIGSIFLCAAFTFVPTLINFFLVPWHWFFTKFLLIGKPDLWSKALGSENIFSNFYRSAYFGAFWAIQTIQCFTTALDLTGVQLKTTRQTSLEKLRGWGYAVELGINCAYGWFNPWGTSGTWIVYRILVTLLIILVQTFAFEYTFKVIFMAMSVFFGGVMDVIKDRQTTRTVDTKANSF